MEGLNVARNIRAIREFRNYTQQYVAAKLEMSTPNYCNIENGKTEITVARLMNIAEVFDLDYRDILSLDLPTVFERSGFAEQGRSAPQSINKALIAQLNAKDEQIGQLTRLIEQLSSRLYPAVSPAPVS